MRVTANRLVQGVRCSVVAVATAAAATLLALILPGAATAYVFKPDRGTVFAGVSDTGDTADYTRFTNRVGKHLPIMQSFHSWDYDQLGALLDRWRAAKVRGMLHIHTEEGGVEEITPRGIARGKGDDFLMRLAFAIGAADQKVYLRPFGEMNNYRNAYCSYNRYGRLRDGHTTHNFRQAWRRLALVVRGGYIKNINSKLRDLGMPKLQKDFGTVALPHAKVAILWTPMTAGSPNIHANRPGAYWPGGRYVDWVGTDLYSKFPNFSGLRRFYYRYRKPFALTEWGAWGKDAPGFTDHVFDWVKNHERTRLLVYYQGWDSTFSIENKPRTRAVLRKRLGAKRYPAYTGEYRSSSSGGVPAG